MLHFTLLRSCDCFSLVSVVIYFLLATRNLISILYHFARKELNRVERLNYLNDMQRNDARERILKVRVWKQAKEKEMLQNRKKKGTG